MSTDMMLERSLSPASIDSILSELPSDFWKISREQWGEIVPESEYTGPMPIGWECNHTPEYDATYNWTVPDLRLRKGIWENFPVILNPVDDGDGTDRYSICWNRRKLAEWRDTRAESFAEWLDYEDYCLLRLMYALELNPNKYIIEEGREQGQICVIAMVHANDGGSVSNQSYSSASVDGRSEIKNTCSLKHPRDIASQFPVCWTQEDKVLYIRFHTKKIKELYESPAIVRNRMIAELKKSDAWTVSEAPTGKNEVLCFVTLK